MADLGLSIRRSDPDPFCSVKIFKLNLFLFFRHVKHYITKKCSIGDWFVLYQMSRNMNQRFFAEFLALLAKRAMEPSAPVANMFEDKAIRLARGDFDLEDDIMDKTLAAEARDHLSSTSRHSNDITTADITTTTNPNFRSHSGRQPSVDGSKDSRVT